MSAHLKPTTPSRNRFSIRRACCEALETRRLLTFVYNATEGDDDLEVGFEGDLPGETRISGGGSGIVSTFDTDIIINLFGGNDRADIAYLGLAKSVTVRGGAGNDFISAGSGHWANNIDGNIYFEESPGEGNDGLTIMDNAAENDHDDTHITASKVFADETFTIDATVHWTSNIEFRSLLLNGGEDDVYMHAIPPGLNISLNLGDDTVLYSPENHVLFGFVTPATISGGNGDDRLVFYDDQGGATPRDYTATPATFMNQVISGIEDIDLNTRPATGAGNSIDFTSLPVFDSITVNGSGGQNRMSVGTAASPIDLDSASALLTVNLPSVDAEIWVQEDDAVVDQYYFYTGAAQNAQRIDHGTFQGVFSGQAVDLKVNAGALNDVFNVAAVRSSNTLAIAGGDGNDTVKTENYGGNTFDNDLDAALRNGTSFRGGNGTDFFDLDDSADQTNDNDTAYYIGSSAVLKSIDPGEPTLFFVEYDATTELVNVTAGAENNTFTFAGASTQSFTLRGGPGNDLFVHDTDVGLQNCRATVQIAAGDIVDQDTIGIFDADPLFNAITEYRFDSNAFSYFTGLTRLGSIGFGGSTEQFDLTQGPAGTTTRLNVKATAFKLTISAGDGNDSFHVGGGDFDNSSFTLLNTQLAGQGGIDSIRFDDRSDAVTAGESETLTLESLRVTKGTKAISYSQFESQTVDAANVGTAQNTISLVNVGSDMRSLTVNGGNSRPTSVNFGAGGIAGLGNANVNLNGLIGDTLSVNDQFNAVNGTIVFETSRFSRNFGVGFPFETVVNHSGVRQINFSGGNDTDFLLISGIAAGAIVNAHAGNGSDIIQLGNDGAAHEVFGTANLWGDAGTDSFGFGVNTAAPANATVTNSTVVINAGPTHSYFSVEMVNGGFGSGADTLNIKSMSTTARFDVGGGADQVTVGDGDYDANITRDVEIFFGFGFGGADSLTIDDRLDTGNDSYQFLAGNIFRKQLTGGGTTAQLTAGIFGAATQTLLANNDNNSIFCSSGFSDLRIFANGGNDLIFADNGTTSVDTGSELSTGGDGVLVNADSGIAGDLPATVRLAANDRVFDVSTYSLGTLEIPAGLVLDVTNNFTLQGVIDMSGSLIVRNASQLTNLRNWLLTGYSGGAWNGSGSGNGAIRSSAAAGSAAQDGVGYGLGSQVAVTTVGPYSISGTNMLIRHTLAGDADLNKQVNIADFARLAGNFNAANRVWVSGDFNFDNTANIGDFSLLAGNFNQTIAARPRSPQMLVEELDRAGADFV